MQRTRLELELDFLISSSKLLSIAPMHLSLHLLVFTDHDTDQTQRTLISMIAKETVFEDDMAVNLDVRMLEI